MILNKDTDFLIMNNYLACPLENYMISNRIQLLWYAHLSPPSVLFRT